MTEPTPIAAQIPIVDIRIPWTPHAKQRPRGKAGQRSYTPKVTKDAEKAIAAAFKEAVGPNYTPTEDPIAVVINMEKDSLALQVIPKPPRLHKRLKGDIDNYAKTILDALNGVAWVDDKQIDVLLAAKL